MAGLLDELEKWNRRVAREQERQYKTYIKEEKRIHKEGELEQKRIQKELELSQAQEESDSFEKKIRGLLSFHLRHPEYAQSVDWNSTINETVIKQDNPTKPLLDDTQSKKLQNELDNFKPNYIQKLFKKEEKIKNEIRRKIIDLQKDEKIRFKSELLMYSRRCDNIQQTYETKSKELVLRKEKAKRILDKDATSYKDAIDEFLYTAKLRIINDKTIIKKDSVELGFIVPNMGEIPLEEKKLGKSGKLLTKPMSQTNRMTLYRDFVCSMIFYVVKQVFLVLPIEKILINIYDMKLNKKTGYMENKSILSVLFVRKTFDGLIITNILPFESLDNFIVNMDYSVKNGFKPVEEIDLKNSK